jgi:hypothetical protein
MTCEIGRDDLGPVWISGESLTDVTARETSRDTIPAYVPAVVTACVAAVFLVPSIRSNADL